MNEFLTFLSLCRKSGAVVFGFDAVKGALEKGKVKTIFLSIDLSDKSRKEVLYFAGKSGTEVVHTKLEMDDFWKSLGKRTGIVAVCDENFSNALKARIDKA